MSFSSNVKAELCRLPVNKKCCAIAESYGALLFGNTFSQQQIKIVTESREFTERLQKLLKRGFGLEADQWTGSEKAGGKLSCQISDPKKIRTIFAQFGMSPEESLALHVNFGILEEPCCWASFLRGAFLAGGSVTDPEKRYHLELVTGHRMVGRETVALMLEMGFYPKDTERNGSSILYFKQSDYIEDFLTMLGAPVCAMRIMEAKVEKDLRNGVNRRVNCETANLTKVVDAAQEQMMAIRRLEEMGRFDELPEKIRSSALLRKENPEATLSELAEMSQPPVTKSAMNHRMRKLIELSGG